MTDDSTPAAIIIHSLDQALAAAAAATALNLPLVLRSAPGAGSTVGVGWFAALGEALAERYPALSLTLILDCADEAGTAMGALRRGIRRIRFTGQPEVAAKLAAIASEQGAALDEDARPPLDLLGEADPEAACRRWLAAQSSQNQPGVANPGSLG
jgi:hypothetical protein